MLILGQTFTIGRGNEIVCSAISHLADRIKGRTLELLVENWGKTWRHLVNDSQLRWIGKFRKPLLFLFYANSQKVRRRASFTSPLEL